MLNEEEIRRAIHLIRGEEGLFEIRVIAKNKKQNRSGYFKDVDKAIEGLKKLNLQDTNVYLVLNEITEACYSKFQRDCFKEGESATQDSDIIARDWLLVDFDPIRPKDTSSSAEELKRAGEKCVKVYNFLLEQNFPRPIVACSGNGYHLLYRIKLKNSTENEEIVKQFLAALDELFSDDKNDLGGIKIDVVNFNASRVCKLYGTLAQKGLNTEERPHRMSRIIKIPEEIKPVESIYLKRIINLVGGDKPIAASWNRYNGDFDVEEFLSRNNIAYRKSSYGSGTKYILDECPFNPSHKAPDSAVFKRSNGAIGFKCLHNSCADKDWKAFRAHFEPNAYEKKQEYSRRMIYESHNRDKEPQKIVEKDEPTLITPGYMKTCKEEVHGIILSGISDFDRLYRGLEKTRVTALSGYAGGSKTTLLSQIMLNAMDEGNRVFCFSGELGKTDVFDWLLMQAAGRNYTEMTPDGAYRVKADVKSKILDWMEGKFYLYNNHYGYNFEAIENLLREQITKYKFDLVCIDNLMAMDIRDLGPNKYEAQASFMWRLHELAQEMDVHIIVVCHPKKPSGLLSLYDVSGASEIVNAVDNIIYVYRDTQQFRNAYLDYFHHAWEGQWSNIWTCVKARYGSVTDDYLGLYFEKESKRLRSGITEHRNYGWNDGFQSIQDLELEY